MCHLIKLSRIEFLCQDKQLHTPPHLSQVVVFYIINGYMKKKFSVAVILFFSVFNIFAIGIGPQLDSSEGIYFGDSTILNVGASCSIKLDKEPIVVNFTTNYDIVNNFFEPAITVDYWLFSPKISNSCNYFLGIGCGLGAEISKNDLYYANLKRIVSGFSWTYYDGFMEHFIQLAIQQENQINHNLKTRYTLKFPLSMGTRFYF